MKRIQRFLSLALFAALLLGVLPVMAFAEGNVCKIGDTEYPTLKAALDDAVDGDTIEFLTDIEFNGSFHIKKSVTFDGAGHKFESTGGTWCCPIWLKETTETYTEENPLTVIFKNMTVTADRIVCDEATFPTRIRFEDVTVNALKGEKDGGAIQEAFGIKNNATTTLEIVDSTVLHDGAGRWYPVIEADSTAKKTIVIQNSTLTKRTSGGAIINGGANTSASIDETSKLINLTESGDKSQNIFRGAMTVDLAKGAEVRNAPTFDCSMDICDSNVTVNDNGAKYVLKSAADKTVTLPALSADVYTDGTNFYSNTVSLKAGTEVTLTKANGKDLIVTKNVASIRVKDPYGIRFEGSSSGVLYGNANVRVGMILIPTDLVEGELTAEVAGCKQVFSDGFFSEENGEGAFRCALVGIPEGQLDRAISARAFAEITLADGTTVVIYADFTVSASLKQVAELHKNAGGELPEELESLLAGGEA